MGLVWFLAQEEVKKEVIKKLSKEEKEAIRQKQKKIII